ncbi:MAG: dTDP-4-dehydrorhamnose 3,5-epimerase, partial [Actinomycetota bacterium]|nr:dTDP-4-dehydrorhamnose 3,5-epimerase [Actinomycetota bacterium]
MKFTETPLAGVWVIELEPIEDERGWFARTFDAVDFAGHGIQAPVVQCNASYNQQSGTLRGLHYQADPHGEPKLIRCVAGAIFDVAVDLRSESATYCGWYGAELSEENGRMLFVPAGLAHGFQTLRDGCQVLYQMGHGYVAEAARGVRWDDPAFGIQWPPEPPG